MVWTQIRDFDRALVLAIEA